METDYYRQVIKEYRKSQKLSQEKFAELLDCDTTYISHIENGKRDPSIDFFIKFSNLSGISFDYMFAVKHKLALKLNLTRCPKEQ